MKKASTSLSFKNILTGSIGNILEWYDFAVYGYFASIISKNFFPEEDKIVALIATFGIFAIGFLVRPLGGVIFGSIGDRLGRKKALTASVFMMAIPTTLIGFLPTYESIGIWAALLLMIMRILQGISVGGELTGSISFIVEIAPKEKRGFYGSTTLFGAVCGILLGSLVGTVLSGTISSENLLQWGWRLPFFAGIFIGFAGLFLRRNMKEAENFNKLKESGNISKAPVKEFLKDHWKNGIITVFALWGFSVSFYMIFMYLATYTHAFLNYNLNDALSINTISMIALLILILVAGKLSDRFGRKKVLLWGLGGLIAFSIPLFMLIDAGEHWHILLAQICFAFLVGSQQGVMPSALVERFPTKIRYTGLSISYNVALALFGGTTPMLCTWLIKTFDNNVMMPGYYLVFTAVVSFIAILLFKETSKDNLS